MPPHPPINMVDLHNQYLHIKEEIDTAISQVLSSTAFINGPQVAHFATQLATYLNVPHVIPCANGTDALQIAYMALGLQPGDEVIIPSFTYAAPAEAAILLHLVPVFIDVDLHNFNLLPEQLDQAYSPRTRAIVPVHLFGQCAPMAPIIEWATSKNLFVIEDVAQALGARYFAPDYESAPYAGTIGHIGCTSFFPTKNLGCFGDGGALITKDPHLAEKLHMITRHGQSQKYHHTLIGCNSRLDTLQAAILAVKLKHLDNYITARTTAARFYTHHLQSLPHIVPPTLMSYSSQTFHQYTLRVPKTHRQALRNHLTTNNIPTTIYYPLPLHQQKAFTSLSRIAGPLSNAEHLCQEVLSLPMHTELTPEMQLRITTQIHHFFQNL